MVGKKKKKESVIFKPPNPNGEPDFATKSSDQDTPPRLVENLFHIQMAQVRQ